MGRTLPAVATLLTLVLGAEAASFYVAQGGDDVAPGTEQQPFATPKRARDAVRQLRAQPGSPGEPVVVSIRGGEYQVTQTIRSWTTETNWRSCRRRGRDFGLSTMPYSAWYGSTVSLPWTPWRSKRVSRWSKKVHQSISCLAARRCAAAVGERRSA